MAPNVHHPVVSTCIKSVNRINNTGTTFLPSYTEKGPMKSPEEEMKGYLLWRKEPSERCASACSHDGVSFAVTGLCFVQSLRWVCRSTVIMKRIKEYTRGISEPQPGNKRSSRSSTRPARYEVKKRMSVSRDEGSDVGRERADVEDDPRLPGTKGIIMSSLGTSRVNVRRSGGKSRRNLDRAARCAETDRPCSVRKWLKPMPHESAVYQVC